MTRQEQFLEARRQMKAGFREVEKFDQNIWNYEHEEIGEDLFRYILGETGIRKKSCATEEPGKTDGHGAAGEKGEPDITAETSFSAPVDALAALPRLLAVFGINPSTAAPGRLDRTVMVVRRFAAQLGYDGYVMLNIYPQRMTDPRFLHDEPVREAVKHNVACIRAVFRKMSEAAEQRASADTAEFSESAAHNKKIPPSGGGTVDVLAAWGGNITRRAYLMECLREICRETEEFPVRWLKIATAREYPHPHHPLYISCRELEIFDIKRYIDTFGR